MSRDRTATLIFWALAVFFYGYEFMVRNAPSVMIPEFMLHYNADHTQFALFSSVFLASYALAQLPAGLLLNKHGPRWILPGALLTVALATALNAYSSSLTVALFTRAISGFAAAFAFIGALRIAASTASKKSFPFFVGLTNLAGVTGGFIISEFLVHAVDKLGFECIYYIFAVIGLVAFALMTISARNIKNKQKVYAAINWRKTIPIGIYAGLLVMPISGFWELWCIPYIQEVYHIDRALAAKSISMVLLGIAIGGPMIGYLQGQFNFNHTFKIASFSCAILLACVILLPPSNYQVFLGLLLLYGFLTAHMLLCFTIKPVVADNAAAIAVINMIITGAGALTQLILGYGFSWVLGSINSLEHLRVSDYRLVLIILPIALIVAHIISWITEELRYAKTNENS